MQTFVNFYFWYLVVFMVLQVLIICTRSYPHTTTKSIGEDVTAFILMASFFLWLLFIRLGVVQ